jgi:hypothetical protein
VPEADVLEDRSEDTDRHVSLSRSVAGQVAVEVGDTSRAPRPADDRIGELRVAGLESARRSRERLEAVEELDHEVVVAAQAPIEREGPDPPAARPAERRPGAETRKAAVQEGADFDLEGPVERKPTGEQVDEPAVVVRVRVREDDVCEGHLLLAQVLEELPADEVGRALLRHLLRVLDATVDQVPAPVRRLQEDPVPLADVDDVDLEQALVRDDLPAQPARPLAAGANAHPVAVLLENVQRVAPEERGYELAARFAPFAERNLERGRLADVLERHHPTTASTGAWSERSMPPTRLRSSGHGSGPRSSASPRTRIWSIPSIGSVNLGTV